MGVETRYNVPQAFAISQLSERHAEKLVICMMLERASIPYFAFEVGLDRLAVAKKEKHKVYYGDVTDPSTMDALAIARARAVIVTTTDYFAVKLIIGTLRQFHPSVKVMTAVPYLFQREELKKMGAAQVVALTPEGLREVGLGRAWHQTR